MRLVFRFPAPGLKSRGKIHSSRWDYKPATAAFFPPMNWRATVEIHRRIDQIHRRIDQIHRHIDTLIIEH